MKANANEMGKLFLRVWQLHNDAALLAECDDEVSERYTIWVDLQGMDMEFCYKTATELGTLREAQLDTVAMCGDAYSGGQRCYAGTQVGWEAADGTMWIDAQLEDDTFN